jgi:hypothetical protein
MWELQTSEMIQKGLIMSINTFCITQRQKAKKKSCYDTDLDKANNAVHKEIMDCIMTYNGWKNGHLE